MRRDRAVHKSLRAATAVLATVAFALLAGARAGGGAPARAATGPCEPRSLPPGYVAAVDAALRAKTDLWGARVLALAGGPTYRSVEGLLTPLFLVGRPAGISGTRLTDSGVYYLPFGEPGGRSFADAGPTEPFALHVADGSQLISRRATGRRVTVFVGHDGTERYGSCLSRLDVPELADGWLPALRVRYADAAGVRYTEESFVARDPRTGALASYLRLEATRGDSQASSTRVRVSVSDGDVTAVGGELRAGGRTLLAFAGPGRLVGGELRFDLALGGATPDAVYLVRPIDPTRGHPRTGPVAYAAARSASLAAWKRRLAGGATVEVPEPLVADAMRNLLLQNLQLSWHYSVGNAYEGFYQAESSASVLALAEYGFLSDARTALETLLPKAHGYSTNLEQGQKLAAGAAYFLLSGDGAFIRRHTPVYTGLAADLAARRAGNPDGSGLLPRQRYGSDITDPVYGLHQQARAWRGLRDMATVWARVGEDALATRTRAEARSLGQALRRAIAGSATQVSSRETFVPVSLLADPPVAPWDPVSATRLGSYWNLVAPYAWSSGIFPRTSALARQVLEYARRRGSFLLGLVRFDYYPTGPGEVRCDGLPGLKTPGTDNVYGVDRSRFLADLDRPDLLVLSLYGQLAHGMTRGTFVSGEGATIGPVPPGACPGSPGEFYRSMYLPPSSTSNAFFLTTLREMLAHWVTDGDGRPTGLHLAYSTPRAWLADGKRVAVRGLPTPFGPLTYSIGSHVADGYLDVEIAVPRRQPVGELRLRLRLPPGTKPALARIGATTLRPDGETFDLSGRTGTLHLYVLVQGA